VREFGIKFIQFSNMSPIFKGGSIAIVGLLALLFGLWMMHKWNEPLKRGFMIYLGLSIFIILYGLFILIFQPNWWALPY